MRIKRMLTLILILIIVFGLVHYRRTHKEAKFIPSVSTVSNTTPTAPESLVSKTSVPSGSYDLTFTAKSGASRAYRVHVPKRYDATKKMPVLFVFHGGFGSAEQIEYSSHLSALSDERGYIAVYGQGTAYGVLGAQVWNGGGCCGQAQEDKKNIDDVGYVREVFAQVNEKYNIDKARVYTTGMSNGGIFSNRLACEASDIFTGAAIVAGTIQIPTCTPTRKIPILIMHGTKDENVPYNGGVGPEAFTKSSYMPVEQGFAEWGMRNGCVGDISTTKIIPLVSGGNTIDKLTFAICAVPVVLYRINGGIHEWPGGERNRSKLVKPEPSGAIDASKTILDFFGI